MADEAFALSPISARAAKPSDADYAAISEAFMETSRGRWFLTEYAKRNRNADTSMVLDAVARIEANFSDETLAEGGLAEALGSIRRSVDEAKTAALQAIDGRAFVESVGPIRKGTRVIREIAWRLREIGADGRICDLIASQVDAIEAACAEIASIDSSDALDSAFTLIEDCIKRFDGNGTAARGTQNERVASHSRAVPDKALDAGNETEVSAVEKTTDAPAEIAPSVLQPPAAPEQVVAVESVTPAEPVIVPAPAEAAISEADTLVDEAVLDRVAMAMGALDSEPAAAEISTPTLAPAETGTAADTIAPVALEPTPSPPSEPSLGESLLANGIVRRPIPSITDPFASIRRLSQAEKIAFFS
jgi:hypothetical protein